MNSTSSAAMDKLLAWIKEHKGISESEVLEKLQSIEVRGMRPVRACHALGILDDSDLEEIAKSGKA